MPTITVTVDLNDWDARAEALGGTGSTLAVAFAARLGNHVGRRDPDDGTVLVQIPMSERTEGDNRANALLFANVRVDPTQLTKDLHDTRATIKQALTKLRESPEDWMPLRELTPLIPFTPQWAMRKLADEAFGYTDLPVGCSNLGDLVSVICRVDGTDAEFVTARGIEQQVTRRRLERTIGQMTLLSVASRASLSSPSLRTSPARRTRRPIWVNGPRARWQSST